MNALASEDGGIEITFTLRYRFPGLWGWLVPRPLVRLGLRLAFANLRRCVEKDPSADERVMLVQSSRRLRGFGQRAQRTISRPSRRRL